MTQSDSHLQTTNTLTSDSSARLIKVLIRGLTLFIVVSILALAYIVTNQPLPLGQLTLSMTLTPLAAPTAGEVVYVHIPAGCYLTGPEFQEPLHEECDAQSKDYFIDKYEVSSTQFAISALTPPPVILTPVVQNIDWIPVELDFNGVKMVLVPAGCFLMGGTYFNDTQPVLSTCVRSPFWIDKYEVTNSVFARFKGVAAQTSYWPDENRPREQITWIEARDFCKLRGTETRLPTELEWEYAARGPSNWIYPWGDSKDLDNVVGLNKPKQQTADVGSHSLGRSWVGAEDMAGNVWEWTSTRYRSYPYNATDGREARDIETNSNFYTVRGGGWELNFASGFRADVRMATEQSHSSNTHGFRCVRSGP
jgi:hypothetical protein